MRRAGVHARPLLALAILLGFGWRAEAQCSASTPSSSTSQRQIPVNLVCPGASFFKLSEVPDFKESESTGVAIEVTNVDPNNEFVDISVTYPAGTPTFAAQPFRMPAETRSPRVLGVLVDFDGGRELTLPRYATPAFLNKLLFSGNHDGRLLSNSLGSWLQQNSYGVVSLTGNVYPGVVHLNAVSAYRPSLGAQGMFTAVADSLVATGYIDPLNNPYDILLIYSAGGLASLSADFYNYNSYWQYKGFEKVLQVDIPVDSTSVLYSQIQNETAVVNADGVVVTKYNPGGTSAGVWLAADVNHSGTNYFASMAWAFQGGVPSISNQLIRYIRLNQPITPGTSVIVTYQPQSYFQIDEATRIALPPDTLFGDALNWFGLISHEFMHLAGSLLSTSWSAAPNMIIGDLYDQPWELIREYDIMAGGGYTATYAFNPYLNKSIRYDTPTHFGGYTKAQMGLLTPYTVGYGRNETSLRLYRTEEVDFLGSANRIKAIKVPLTAPGDKIGMQLVGYNNSATKKYYGDDFLILEWRSTAPFAGGGANFDQPLPGGGLVIYRVLDGGPSPTNSSYYHGNQDLNTIAIEDATPPLPPYASLNDYTVVRQSSISATSPATFGPASGVYRYLASEVRSWKNAGDAANLDIELSAGAGTKTVYAKFMDLNGNIVGTSSFQVTLLPSGGTCAAAAPLVTVTPSTTSAAAPGTPVNYTVAVTNNDSSTCNGSTFSLGGSFPSGWTAAFTVPSLSLVPGATSSTTLRLTSPTTASSGTYSFQARAADPSITVHDASAPGSYSVASTTATAPGAPRSVTASVSGNTAGLSWQAPSTGSLPTNYLLYVGTRSGATDVANGYNVGNVLSASGDLQKGTYYARVRAANSIGTSPDSNEVRFSIGRRLKTPSGFNVTWSGTTATLSWTVAAADSPEDTPTNYVLEAGTTPGASNVARLDVGNRTVFRVEITSGRYYVRVKAQNAFGISEPTEDIEVRTPGTPQAPTALSVGGLGATVDLRWTASAGGYAPAGYIIEAGSGPGLADLATLQVGNVTRFTTTAPPGVYYVRVRAVNARGTSLPSNEVVVRR
jgi:hypothetical protein